MARRYSQTGDMHLKMLNVTEVLTTLERGLSLTRFTRKRCPDRKMYRVKLETRELLRLKTTNERGYQVVVNLGDVSEVRQGQGSMDFERWQSVANDPGYSFVLLYGREFNLKTFSVVASNAEEYQIWIQGLEHLVKDIQNCHYPATIERWLRMEFQTMENRMHVISNKDLKNWMAKINFKPGNRLKEICQEVEPGMKDVNFKNFCKLYQNIIHQQSIFQDLFKQYMSDGKSLSPEDMAIFLTYEQKDSRGENMKEVRNIMTAYLEITGSQRTPSFRPHQFLDYLYSKENTVWDSRQDQVNQDMNKPLSNYWIASSHNTYLTGDQFSSESSCEAYIRVLRMGCRCIELDCWDGDKEPVIYHGHTLTSKIQFIDVLKVIRDHAWDVSEYPLILSIENHCSLPQQRFMASNFRKVFGDTLLTDPVSTSEKELPSPGQLRRKIILKHKKLPEGGDGSVSVSAEDYANDDLSQAKLTGLLYMEDAIDLKWKPHYFVLTTSKVVFSDETRNKEEDEDLDEEEVSRSEKWFHGIVNRNSAGAILEKWGPKLGDGTFLVRRREGSVAEYCVSFWRHNEIKHCRIETSEETNGCTQYWLLEDNKFSNICSLIEYYKVHALHTKAFQQTLGKPVPKESSHVRDEWFHNPLSRDEAIDMLSRVPYDGAFLIRRRDRLGAEYAATFRAEGKIKHCRINQDVEGHYTVGTAEFESLEDLVEYYTKHSLYRKTSFRYPVNKDIVARVGTSPEEQSIYMGANYIAPNEYTSDIQARALYNYAGKRSDELSFKKDAILTNINKIYDGWWRGDLDESKQHWFPANYVEEIELEEEETPLGSLQQGAVQLQGCSIVRAKTDASGRFPFRFRITNPEKQQLIVACNTEEELEKWIQTTRQCITAATTITMSAQTRLRLEKKMKIAQELSDLVIYCQTVDFDPEKGGPAHEMSSLPEPKAEKWCAKNPTHCKLLLSYNQTKFTRVYPRGVRIDSSNYDPMPMWVAGCHMVSLNYQTPDRPMQLNQGLFALNGRSGYVLKPKYICGGPFNPLGGTKDKTVDPLTISLTILGARHLTKTGRGIPNPFVEVEIAGTKFDSIRNTFKTQSKDDNGLNPVWNEACEFDVSNPDLALIRFVVQDEDMFGDPNFMGQAVFPVTALRSGYRSVPLKNGYNEDLPLASLLIHAELTNPEEEYEEIYSGIMQLRDESDKLEAEIEQLELAGNTREAQHCVAALTRTKQQLSQKKEERKAKKQQKKAKHTAVRTSGKRKASHSQ